MNGKYDKRPESKNLLKQQKGEGDKCHKSAFEDRKIKPPELSSEK